MVEFRELREGGTSWSVLCAVIFTQTTGQSSPPPSYRDKEKLRIAWFQLHGLLDVLRSAR